MNPIDLCIFVRSSSIVIMEVGRSSTMQLSMTRFHCIDVLGTQLIDCEDVRRRKEPAKAITLMKRKENDLNRTSRELWEHVNLQGCNGDICQFRTNDIYDLDLVSFVRRCQFIKGY